MYFVVFVFRSFLQHKEHEGKTQRALRVQTDVIKTVSPTLSRINVDDKDSDL